MGRCSYPACGIGVNALRGADPYPNEHSCRFARDPVNYRYPLVSEDRSRNALARWGAFREEYGLTVRYNPELPEAKALAETVKKQLEGYESGDALIAKIKALADQLRTA